jgi:NitT/TauT family transport system ATP-binding protein
MSQIKMTGIKKSYDKGKVLDGVNFSLNAGITCLMGASGIGKTTLAHILAGLTKADGGRIDGVQNIKVSMVFQEDRLLSSESALINILFVAGKKQAKRAIQLLNHAGLGSDLDKKANELSGGMKRRVALCRALMAEHELLILDEPFKGLDDETKAIIIDMVRTHAAKNPRTAILCITHDGAEAAALGGAVVNFKNM